MTPRHDPATGARIHTIQCTRCGGAFEHAPTGPGRLPQMHPACALERRAEYRAADVVARRARYRALVDAGVCVELARWGSTSELAARVTLRDAAAVDA